MTLFEKIVRREIPADIVYEDDHVMAFRDIHPQAPVHLLVIPKEPIPRLSEASDHHTELLGRLLQAVRRVASEAGLAAGYRVVINNGDHGGQEVPHLHLHVLGGRQLTWPPG